MKFKMPFSIDSVLKKRFDLIPNLIWAVKEYMEYEKQTLNTITNLRTKALKTSSAKEKFAINEEISSKIQDILVAVENYPQLKSSQNMLQLQQALAETKEQVSGRTYNQAITNYNNACEQIPTKFIASFLKYEQKEVLKSKQRENINVKEEFKKL